MRVYKFLPAHWAHEAIKRQRLKISHFNSLNDPWEFRSISFCNPAVEGPKWEKIQALVSQIRGVVCFSRNWNNPVLWSHYAENHFGVVLGFDLAQCEIGGEKIVYPVDYVEVFVQCPPDLISNPVQTSDNTEFLLRSMATKFKDWRYEDEVRVFPTLEEPDESSNHFFLSFDGHLP